MVFNVKNYKILVFGNTDVGLVRKNNEDYWTQLPDEKFYVLADGMGGHKGGEVASREAAQSLCADFKEKLSASPNKDSNAVMELLFDAICDANQIVYRMGKQFEELRGMGTTLCCLYIHDEGLIYAHVGDSRIYRLRNNELQKLTRDDSLLRELIDLGQITEQQSDNFLYKNILTKAVGTAPSIEPTVAIDNIENNDMIIMCSDGLTDMLTDEDIKRIMLEFPEREVAPALVNAAIEKGGFDNVTVVLVKIQENHGK